MPKRREIRSVANFRDLYQLGKEVMPTSHRSTNVYYGSRVKDGKGVVVKVTLKSKVSWTKEEEEEWRRGTEFILQLPRHRNIAKVVEVLEDDQQIYGVFERVLGVDLYEEINNVGRPAPPVVKSIMCQLFQALAFLHGKGAIHRDLKLENVMVGNIESGSPFVKLIDFDTLQEWDPAAVADIDDDLEQRQAKKHNRLPLPPNSPELLKEALEEERAAKAVVGTDQYIAPEAYACKYSPASDVFAAGVIAYKTLTGWFPFHQDVFNADAKRDFKKIVRIQSRLKASRIDFKHPALQQDARLCDLLKSLLSFNPAERPSASAAAEHAWFEGADLRSSPDLPGSPSSVPSPRTRAYSGVSAMTASASTTVSGNELGYNSEVNRIASKPSGMIREGIVAVEEVAVNGFRKQFLLRT